MKRFVMLACALALSAASAVTVPLVKWYGAEYATTDNLGKAVSGLSFTRTGQQWTVKLGKDTLVMTDNSTKGTINGQAANIGSPPRVIDGVSFLPFDDVVRLLNITGLTGQVGQVLAKSDYVAPAPRPTIAPPVQFSPAPVATQQTYIAAQQPAVAPAAAPAPTQPAYVAPQPPAPRPPFTSIKLDRAANFDNVFSSIDVQYAITTQPTDAMLFGACRNWVQSNLKSPSSAEFSSGQLFTYLGGGWMATGVFDSQNSYGAMLRGDYACFMRQAGDRLQVVSQISTRK